MCIRDRVIAGAGSGKTNTLAHRVAHLILNGADPQRMLLLTFSRRAAQEMERRVGSVLQRVMNLRGKMCIRDRATASSPRPRAMACRSRPSIWAARGPTTC